MIGAGGAFVRDYDVILGDVHTTEELTTGCAVSGVRDRALEPLLGLSEPPGRTSAEVPLT